MLELGLKALAAYLLGSIMGALVAGTLRGVDIREQGSGNAGGTNALRTQGLAFALVVVVIDVGKGLLAVAWLPGLDIPGVGIDPAVARDWLTMACATLVVIGHVWPVFHQFRGGKGAATLIGAVAVLMPWALLPAIGLWLVVVVITGYVGLGTMAAGLTLPVSAMVLAETGSPSLSVFTVLMAGFMIYTHRANIARMRAGTESRARRLWRLGRAGPRQ